MKYKKNIFSIALVLVILLAFIIKGNFFRYNDISELIGKPKSLNLQINGVWNLEKIENIVENNSDIDVEKFQKLYISEDFVKFSNNYTDFPKFKFRYINYEKYISSKGIINSSYKGDESVIITVDDGDFFYQEFIKIDDSHIAVVYDKKYLIYELEDRKFDKTRIKFSGESSNTSNNNFVKAEEMDTSLLIGYRDKGNFKYSTILFRSDNKKKPVIKKVDGIFVNKNNNFFMINNILENGIQKGIYFSKDYIEAKTDKILKTNGNITFVGENYLSLEVQDKNTGQKTYEIHSNENIMDNDKITITELAGENGRISYYDSIRKITNEPFGNFYEDTDNIGVYRKNAMWNFKSVFNNNSNNKLASTEFNLDIIPLLPVFEKSTHKFSNSTIKNLVPESIDYFVSPNENIIAILTTNEVMIFTIENQKISTLPISVFSIPNTAEIVMFQWKINENSNITFSEFSKLKTEDVSYR